MNITVPLFFQFVHFEREQIPASYSFLRLTLSLNPLARLYDAHTIRNQHIAICQGISKKLILLSGVKRMSNLPSGNEANSALLPKIVNVFNLNITVFIIIVLFSQNTSKQAILVSYELPFHYHKPFQRNSLQMEYLFFAFSFFSLSPLHFARRYFYRKSNPLQY